MKTAIIGGGAAGFFLAVNLKEMLPEMEVDIFERSQRVLAKVAVSGGGRCNCTNSFRCVRDLSAVYPRGHRLMKRLFNVFSPQDAYRWFESHGVELVIQDDECVFPQAQSSQAIIDCFLSLAHRYHVRILKGRKVQSMADVSDYDFVAVTTGGSPSGAGLRWLSDLGHHIESPVPSSLRLLFSAAQRVAAQCLHVVADLIQLPGDANALWAVGRTLSTLYAVVGLSQPRNRTVQPDEVIAAQRLVVLVSAVGRQQALILALVIVYEDGRDVNAVGARHTVLTVVAGNILQTNDSLCNLLVKVTHLRLLKRNQRTIRQQVVLEMLHIGHA